MKRKLSSVIAILACFVVMLGFSLSATAASYSAKRLACSRCGQVNTSYGYDANFHWDSVSVNGGHLCDGCGQVVPEGENHTYLQSSDKYFFTCNSASCRKLDVPKRVYTHLYKNPVSEHYTNGIRDY